MTIDLTTQFTGLDFVNPFVLASAPPTESKRKILKAFEAAAAVLAQMDEEQEVIKAEHEFVEAIKAKIPMGEFGAVEDVAGAALFLASPAAQYMTGQVLTVDGGMVM